MLLVAVVALLAFAWPSAALAEDLVVTSVEDDGDGTCDASCSLRDAVDAAENGDRVVLKAETYSLTRGQLVLDGAFNIEGAGARMTFIQSNFESRIGYVATGADVTLDGLSAVSGRAQEQAPDGGRGGGFRVAERAELVLNRASVTDNAAASAGGGISTSGRVFVIESTVSSNTVGAEGAGSGGGIQVEQGGEAVLVNATVSGNVAFPDGQQQEPGRGGGVHSAGTLTMENATIAFNSATEAGGLYQGDAATSMWNTLIARNDARACGGAVGLIGGDHNLSDDDTCALDGPGDLQNASPELQRLDDHGGPTNTHAIGAGSEAIDKGTADHCPRTDQRLFSRNPQACDLGAVERRPTPVVNTLVDGDDGNCTAEPDGCTLRDALVDSESDAQIELGEGTYEVSLGELRLRGSRSIFGEGARATTIEATGNHRVLTVVDGGAAVGNVQITGGSAGGDTGGGIRVEEAAGLTLMDSSVVDNHAASGGGIANYGGLVVTGSTLAANTSGTGGGLLVGFQAWASLMNVTISGNTATDVGGGIANDSGELDTRSVTIAANKALSGTGAGVYGDATLIDAGSFYVGDTFLNNTIVATNEGGECAWDTGHQHFARHSLIDDDTCFPPGDQSEVTADPRLGPLTSDLGPTAVHPLLDGSPAIDAGDDHDCPGNDQRGAPRPQGFRCDIGAYEGGVGVTRLRVVTEVAGGSAQPADFTLRVFSGGEEMDSAPGSASGTTFELDPGTYQVRRSGPAGYVPVFSGACDASGEVVIQAGVTTCTLTLDHVSFPAESCLDYPTFAQPAGLTLLGSAAVGGGVLTLNPDSGGVGAAWYGARRPVAEGFTADFALRITPPGGGADGMAFVIQNHAPDAIGEGGGGQGYQGIPNSLAVEFDTWDNGGEPGATHVAVHSLGTSPNSALSGQYGAAVLASFRDGQAHAARVVYSPGRLHLFVDDMETPKLSVEVDLATLLNLSGGAAFVGFTAATGAFTEGHHVERWRLCSAQQPTNLSPPPQENTSQPPLDDEQEQLPPPDAGRGGQCAAQERDGAGEGRAGRIGSSSSRRASRSRSGRWSTRPRDA